MSAPPPPNLSVTEIKAFVPAKDFERSKNFYRDIGFTMASEGGGIAYFSIGDASFLLRDFCADGFALNFRMHLLVEDVDAWWKRIDESNVVQAYGVTLSPIELQPWRMRDFCLTDPSGVLWRVARTSTADAARRSQTRPGTGKTEAEGASAGIRAPHCWRTQRMVSLTINGKLHELDIPDDMPLLWAIRDVVGLTGTKFGCGVAQCGCCTVHVGDDAVRSCVTPVSTVAGKSITTIEALGTPEQPSALQQAWIDVEVPQCGYCQSGQLMAISGLLKKNPHPTNADLAASITNICRCGTYDRIRKAVARATGNGQAS